MNNFQSYPINKNEKALMTYNAILNNTHEHIYFKDLDSKFILLSASLAKYLGLDSPEEAIGKSDFDFFSHIHAQQAYNDEQRIIATGEPLLNFVEMNVWDSGSSQYVITSKYPLYDDDGNLTGTWGHSISLDDLQHSKEGASLKEVIENRKDLPDYSTQIDQLTNLPNAKAFFNAMNLTYQMAMNQMHNKHKDHALIMIDIEGFHAINEDLGHHGGDSALVFMSNMLADIFGSKENIYMYGTNSFAVIMEVGSIQDATDICKEVVRISQIESFQHEEWDLNLLLNIGLCTFKEALPIGTIYDIINLADVRLAEAKKSGPNNIVYERK